jgi:hypothetical protein
MFSCPLPPPEAGCSLSLAAAVPTQYTEIVLLCLPAARFASAGPAMTTAPAPPAATLMPKPPDPAAAAVRVSEAAAPEGLTDQDTVAAHSRQQQMLRVEPATRCPAGEALLL